MVQTLSNWHLRNGNRVTVDVREENAGGQAFFDKLGFDRFPVSFYFLMNRKEGRVTEAKQFLVETYFSTLKYV